MLDDFVHDEDGWENLTKVTLTSFAKVLRLKGYSTLNKTELIHLLIQYVASNLELIDEKKIFVCNQLSECKRKCICSHLNLINEITATLNKQQKTTILIPKKEVREPQSESALSDSDAQLIFFAIVADETNWLKLTRPDLENLHQSFFGTPSTANKSIIVEKLMGRVNDIINRFPDRIEKCNKYVSRLSDAPTVFLINLPSILLPRRSNRISEEHFAFDMNNLRDELIITNLIHKRDNVRGFRKNIDLYSQLSVDKLQSPEVDHVVERQFAAYAMLTSNVDRHEVVKEGFIAPIRQVINDVTNLNITAKAINISKGTAFTQFLKEEKYSGTPRELHVIMLSDNTGRERAVARVAHNVMKAFHETGPIVKDAIYECRRQDNFVNASIHYEQIVDRLGELLQKTGVDSYFSDRILSRHDF
jgi:hypothetical protein